MLLRRVQVCNQTLIYAVVIWRKHMIWAIDESVPIVVEKSPIYICLSCRMLINGSRDVMRLMIYR